MLQVFYDVSGDCSPGYFVEVHDREDGELKSVFFLGEFVGCRDIEQLLLQEFILLLVSDAGMSVPWVDIVVKLQLDAFCFLN